MTLTLRQNSVLALGEGSVHKVDTQDLHRFIYLSYGQV